MTLDRNQVTANQFKSPMVLGEWSFAEGQDKFCSPHLIQINEIVTLEGRAKNFGHTSDLIFCQIL